MTSTRTDPLPGVHIEHDGETQSHYHPYCGRMDMWGLEWPSHYDAIVTLDAWSSTRCTSTHTVIFHPDPVDSISLAAFFSTWR